MSSSPWYRRGSVELVNGSRAVTGTDTQWINEIDAPKPGDLFIAKNHHALYEITAFTTGEALTLDRGFEGPSASASEYAIVRHFAGTTMAQLAADLTALQRKWHVREEQMITWLSTDASQSPLSDVLGNTRLVMTPAELERRALASLTSIEALVPTAEQLEGRMTSLETRQANAETEINENLTASRQAATDAQEAKTEAQNQASQSASSASEAKGYRDDAASSASAASQSETKAKAWSESEAEVEPNARSSKYHAGVATTAAVNTQQTKAEVEQLKVDVQAIADAVALAAGDAVRVVNGHTGTNITLDKSDIGLDQVANYPPSHNYASANDETLATTTALANAYAALSGLVSNHTTGENPHPQYLLKTGGTVSGQAKFTGGIFIAAGEGLEIKDGGERTTLSGRLHNDIRIINLFDAHNITDGGLLVTYDVETPGDAKGEILYVSRFDFQYNGSSVLTEANRLGIVTEARDGLATQEELQNNYARHNQSTNINAPWTYFHSPTFESGRGLFSSFSGRYFVRNTSAEVTEFNAAGGNVFLGLNDTQNVISSRPFGLTDLNTVLGKGVDDLLLVQNPNGKFEVGARNSSYVHYMGTSASGSPLKNYFNNDVHVKGDLGVYGTQTRMRGSDGLILQNGETLDSLFTRKNSSELISKDWTFQSNILLDDDKAIQSAASGNSLFKVFSNGSTTLSANAGKLFLGYENTTGINLNANIYANDGTSLLFDVDSRQVFDGGNRVYSPNNKPGAADVGALALSGGTLTGELAGTSTIFSGYVLAEGGKVRLNSRAGTGVLRLSNGANWGLLASGDNNAPRVGAYHDGQLVIQGYADSDGTLDSDKMLVTFNFQYDKTEFHKLVDFYGDLTVKTGRKIQFEADDSHDKIRLYPSSYYAIGFKASQTYGWLNAWATTFTTRNHNDYGFSWRRADHTDAQALMSLSGAGHLCLAGVIGLGGTTARYIYRNGDQLGWKNSYGYTNIGPQNGSFSHFITDRPAYYFDKKITIGGNVVSSYNADLYLQRANTTMLTLGSSSATFAKHLNVPTIEVTSNSARHLKDIKRRVRSAKAIRHVVEGIGKDGIHLGYWTKAAQEEKGLNDKPHAWLMADVVGRFAPHLTTQDEFGRHDTVNYLELVPYLLGSQAHEYQRVDRLNQQVWQLQKELASLKEAIKAGGQDGDRS